jgi:hypothetical protein
MFPKLLNFFGSIGLIIQVLIQILLDLRLEVKVAWLTIMN